MQIQAIKYHCTPNRMANIWNTVDTKCWQGDGEIDSYSLLVGMKNGAATSEDILVVSSRTRHTLTV